MAAAEHRRGAGRLRRLLEELEEVGVTLDAESDAGRLLLDEIDSARHPQVHERRVASAGSIVEPTTDTATWGAGTGLDMTCLDVGEQPLAAARRFADGLASWLLRRVAGGDQWVVFDRPAGSERDLVVLAEVLGAAVVQRHPTGVVRVAGAFGVLRWEGIAWHREPPIASWVDAVTACPAHGEPAILQDLLEFAVHDLGARGTGATLIYRPDAEPGPPVEERLPPPPPLHIQRPTDLAPLRHALGQVDGAAVFDAAGTLVQLGVRLVPTSDAETSVAGVGGMRHTSGIRYSHDDPLATVIVVSEDGPVSVFRRGELVGRSPDDD